MIYTAVEESILERLRAFGFKAELDSSTYTTGEVQEGYTRITSYCKPEPATGMAAYSQQTVTAKVTFFVLTETGLQAGLIHAEVTWTNENGSTNGYSRTL